MDRHVPSALRPDASDLPGVLRRAWARLGLPPGPVLVAVSGGPDSVALLDLIHGIAPPAGHPLVVAHVDHGIHPRSAEVAALVARHAARLGLPLESVSLALGSDCSETRARDARWRWLRDRRSALGAVAIVTAHHADDQVETVLARLLRGSGPAGLAGMAPRSGAVVRPLLGVPRAALAAWVERRGLESWDDPANADPRHLRSWLRHTALPALRAGLPDADAMLRRSGRQAAHARRAWDGALESIALLALREEQGVISVAAPPLAAYDSAFARELLMALGRRAGRPFGLARADRVLGLVRRGRSGRRIELGAGWVAWLSFGRLSLGRSAVEVPPVAVLEGREGAVGWGGWTLAWRPETAPATLDRSGFTTWVRPTPLRVAPPVPGERLRPLGGRGRRLLVRLLQDARVDRAERGGWPALRTDDEVIWLPGVCRSGALVPRPGEEALRIDARHA